MEGVYSRCCGLDVHKKSISACIMIREHGRIEKLEHRFGTFTEELEDMANWLAEHQVTHVAMEATGVYWKPVWNILEGRFDLMLVNPEHINALAGKKCDRRDMVCYRVVSFLQWISVSYVILHGTAPAQCKRRRELRVGSKRSWRKPTLSSGAWPPMCWVCRGD